VEFNVIPDVCSVLIADAEHEAGPENCSRPVRVSALWTYGRPSEKMTIALCKEHAIALEPHKRLVMFFSPT
jgi:hypothetical protein